MLILGDARSNMVQNHRNKVDEIKNNYAHKKDYYIFHVANWDSNSMTRLKNTYMIMDKKPPKMLNSTLYYINNKTGQEELIWSLPGDWDVDVSLLDENKSCENVQKYAQDMKSFITKS